MSSSANFSEQIEKVASSMKNMISWVLRTFQLRNRFALVTLWKSLILPIHDYCSQLWSPHKLGDIQRFELLQWYFLKKIKHVNDNDYCSRIPQLFNFAPFFLIFPSEIEKFVKNS